MSENEVIVEDQTIERLEPPKAGQKAIYKNCTIQNIVWKDLEIEGELILQDCTIQKLSFKDLVFTESFQAVNSSIDLCFWKNIQFQNRCVCKETIFKHGIQVLQVQFQWGCDFQEAIFQKDARIDDSEFLGHTKFDKIRAQQRFEATRCKFGSPNPKQNWFRLLFSNARFEHIVIFQDCSFLFPTNLKRARFEEEVQFIAPNFYDIVSFENARFSGLLRLKNIKRLTPKAYFHFGGIQLEKFSANHEELSLFLLCLAPDQYSAMLKQILEAKEKYAEKHPPEVIELAKKNLRLAELVRFEEASQTLAELNRAFHDTFNEDGENWSYITQKRLERAQSSFTGQVWNYLLDFSCRYGTSPLIVLRTAGLSLSFFTLFFWFSPQEFTATADFPAEYLLNGTISSIPFSEALIFSFQVFTSSELVPHIEPKPSLNFLMMAESVIGYIIMMLLVITLSRRVIRS